MRSGHHQKTTLEKWQAASRELLRRAEQGASGAELSVGYAAHRLQATIFDAAFCVGTAQSAVQGLRPDGAPPPAAPPAAADTFEGVAEGLCRRLRASSRRTQKLRFSLAPTPSFKTNFIDITDAGVRCLHYEFSRHPSRPANFIPATRLEHPKPERDAATQAAWCALFKPEALQKSSPFAGGVSTDGVSLSVRVLRRPLPGDPPPRSRMGARAVRAAANAAALKRALTEIAYRVRADPDVDPKTLPPATDIVAWDALFTKWGVRFVAVDPGIRHFITALVLGGPFDPGTRSPEPLDGIPKGKGGAHRPGPGGPWHRAHSWRANSRQHRNACAFDAYKRWRAGHLRRADPADRAAVAAVPTARTAHAPDFFSYCRAAVAAFEPGMRLYATLAHRRWAVRVQRAKHKQLHRLAQSLICGKPTVSGRWRARRTTQPRPGLTIIAWGAASIGAGSPVPRAYIPPVRQLETLLRRHYRSDVIFLLIDEYKTSQVCPFCWEIRPDLFTLMGPKEGPKSRCTAVLACPGCMHSHINRDASASMAIAARSIGQLAPDARRGGLDSFERKSKAP